ncbi:MAG TPA: hypothetical protein DIS94_11525 [Bacteroidetes bacterium]|nr:hypothetical protein [Bacteroidota bacterium]HRF66827.1 hypothetical protein [Ignavibacteria bacterium]HRJ84844.1 hypothetical protein [Ignavibacteria bacterium]
MALRKRNSSIKIANAAKRHEAMINIDKRYDKNINYGWKPNPLTASDFIAQIEECKKLICEYNAALEIADRRARDLNDAETLLGDLFTRVIAGGKSIFGVDSPEVKELGGTRRSERKRKYNSNN